MKNSLFFVLVIFAFLMLLHCSTFAQVGPTGHEPEGQVFQVTAPTPPTGEIMRYVIPYFTSITGSGSRSMTGITVNNNTTKECTVSIQFQKGRMPTVECSITATVPAGYGGYFCSRSVPANTYPCNASGTCASDLTLAVGRVYISSNSACSNISVDGEVMYTSDASDTLITGVRQLGLVKFNKPNTGD